MRWISEKDNGMYEAIIKGFSLANGEIYAWLNSDDMYMPWACEVVASVMSKTGIKWCTGVPSNWNERGVQCLSSMMIPVYPRRFIKNGYMDGRIGLIIQQESTFWTRNLWDKCGSVIGNYKMAGDYHLWKEFAKHEPLITLNSIISGFRSHSGQKSAGVAGGGISSYFAEVGSLSLFRKILRKTRIIKILQKISFYVFPKLFLHIKEYIS